MQNRYLWEKNNEQILCYTDNTILLIHTNILRVIRDNIVYGDI